MNWYWKQEDGGVGCYSLGPDKRGENRWGKEKKGRIELVIVVGKLPMRVVVRVTRELEDE